MSVQGNSNETSIGFSLIGPHSYPVRDGSDASQTAKIRHDSFDPIFQEQIGRFILARRIALKVWISDIPPIGEPGFIQEPVSLNRS